MGLSKVGKMELMKVDSTAEPLVLLWVVPKVQRTADSTVLNSAEMTVAQLAVCLVTKMAY
jgi:hypothetical protein